MPPLLSVVIPLSNLHVDFGNQLERLLEYAADLTPHFEVVILSDLPRDGICENVSEAARSYPQVRFEELPRFASDSVAACLQSARGGVAIVIEKGAPLSPSRLQELWKLQQEKQVLAARAQSTPDTASPGWLERLMRWGEQLRASAPSSGIQILRKQAAEDFQPEDFRQVVLEYRLDAAHPALESSRGFLQHLRNLVTG